MQITVITNTHTYIHTRAHFTHRRIHIYTHHKQAAIVDVRRMLVRSRDMRDLQTDRTETAFSERVGRNLHASGDTLIRRTRAGERASERKRTDTRRRRREPMRYDAPWWRRTNHRPAYRGYCSTLARYCCTRHVVPLRNSARSVLRVPPTETHS